MDVCILAFGIMMSVLLLGVILSRRHGRALALAVLMGVLLLSLVAALAGYLSLNESLRGEPDSSSGWHKMAVPGGRVVKLRYKPASGLLVTTENGETNPIRDVPFCLADGKLAQLAPNHIETATNPYVALPQPPCLLKQQVSFNLSYAISTAGLGASSFGIDENGELWCTERLYQANAGGTDSAFLTISYMTIMIFAGSFAVIVIPVAITLEIRRWHNTRRRSSASTHETPAECIK